jgi:hypothetical protein
MKNCRQISAAGAPKPLAKRRDVDGARFPQKFKKAANRAVNLIAILSGQRAQNIAQSLLMGLGDLDAGLKHAVERIEPGL